MKISIPELIALLHRAASAADPMSFDLTCSQSDAVREELQLFAEDLSKAKVSEITILGVDEDGHTC